MKHHVESGMRFDRLVAVSRVAGSQWLFKCDCGKEIVRFAAHVARKVTKSCGCLKVEKFNANRCKSGRPSHGMSQSKTYQIWHGMMQRCVNPKHIAYANYGGRGIKVCERWQKFENFLADMGEQPEGMSIDRCENNGDYEPGNVKWETRRNQSRNTRRNRVIKHDGKTMCVRDWEIHMGYGRGCIQRRLDAGWPELDAVSLPIAPGKPLRRRK